MTLLYEDTSDLKAALVTRAVVSLNRMVCEIQGNTLVEVTFHSSTEARVALMRLAKEGYYDARRYVVREGL